MKTLILTEKPSVARDFAKALSVNNSHNYGFIEDDHYIITWAIGHLLELFEPEDYHPKYKQWKMDTLPIIPDQFQYKPIVKTEPQLNIIKNIINKKPIDKIVIATDAGREGEVIARTILSNTGLKKQISIFRFWTSQALTTQVVREGMSNVVPSKQYDRLWKAGQARQIADWLVGMNNSRAATIKMNDLFSVGRVQTAVLALLVDRRRERENFKPEPFWIIKALFNNQKGDWWGQWFTKNETRFTDETKVKGIIAKVKDQTGQVTSVKTQKKKQAPPPLFSLTELQRDANTKYGFSAQQILQLAQDLYEKFKCLSYPRTDSQVLGSKNVDLAKSIVNTLSSVYPNLFQHVDPKLINASNKRVFNDSKLTDHHAIIPLSPLPSNASYDHQKIYHLVLTRFAAAFHPDCEYQQTEIITTVMEETFRTRGKIILKPGFQVLYDKEQTKSKKKSEEDDEQDQDNLPPLKKNDPALAKEVNPLKKMTTPPPQYTDALLLKDMTNPGRYVSDDQLKKIYRGEIGLGTQATRAQIIETLLARKYALREKRTIQATDKGCHLIESLRRLTVCGKMTMTEETARWEMQLEDIARGKGSEQAFIQTIKEYVTQSVNELKQSNPMLVRKSLGNCPNCKGSIIEGHKNFGCTNYSTKENGCTFLIPKKFYGRLITPFMTTQLLIHKTLGPLDGLIMNDKTITGNITLVKKDHQWQVQLEPISDRSGLSETQSNLLCPLCGGMIVSNTIGFGCSNFNNKEYRCRFIIFKTIAQYTITADIVKELLEKGVTSRINGFVSKKTNKQFSARLKLERNSSGGLSTVFDFTN